MLLILADFTKKGVNGAHTHYVNFANGSLIAI